MRNYYFVSIFVGLLGVCPASSDSVVVFNEIMYHPEEGGAEWVELHNQMTVNIDLSRWRLDGGIDFAFPEGTIIPGGGYLVIAGNPELTEGAMGPFNRRLANGGESIRLYSASDRLMNRVDYDDENDWPVGPDGSGFSLAKVRRDSAAEDAANWWWSDEPGGSPGRENFPGDRVETGALRLNEITGEDPDRVEVELVNASGSSLDLAGQVLVHSGNEAAVPLPAVSLEPGEMTTLVIGGAKTGDRLFLYGPDKSSLLDAAQVKRRARGRFPDGSGDWFFTSEVTIEIPNKVERSTDIVINEILYHHRPQYRDGETPFAEIDHEWIELYHRGQSPVDLTDWELDGEVEYAFPEDTILDPGAYLVIDNREGTGFEGRLPNSGGLVQLKDAKGNLADEVRYFDDGDWPEAADGGGSSLELIDPRADNANPMAWSASDESARTAWQEIRYRGVAEASSVGPDNAWREFVVGLLYEGETLIDDIQVIEDPDGRAIPLINNSTFQASIFGGGPLRNWRLRGNHRHGEIVPDPEDPENDVLRLVATGPTGHMHNNVEITLSGGARISNGETYEVRYRARPVNGSPQVLTRLYFNRLARTTILQTPAEMGTPGKPNSRFRANVGPTLSSLSHQPAVPSAEESVTVQVRAADPDGVEDLRLHWSVDGGEFQETAMMLEEEGEGDVYAVRLPPQAPDAVVNFYVSATDGAGVESIHPAGGPAARALYQVRDPGRLEEGSRLNPFRIIMTPEDTAWLHEDIRLMSNGRLSATVIYKESKIFYNVGVRLKGSERGRVTTPRLGFNVKFPSQRRFRGIHRTVAIDRSEGVNFGQFEMLFNQMMTHSGSIPSEYNDLIYVIPPQDRHTGAAELQLARYGDIFLDSQFEDGSEGNLYEYELVYYPTTDDAEGYKRPQPDSVVGTPIRDLGDHREDYRWTYLLKNNRSRDAFAPIMEYAKLFSLGDTAFQEALPGIVDVDRWLQGMALALLSGSGDQYGANSQHNAMFYQRPDGKFILFPHDLDFARSESRSITENTALRKILRNPAYERMYLGHVHNILETTFNESYMTRWARHFGELLPGQNFEGHLNYVIGRSRNAKTQLNRMAPQTNFSIQANSGQDFEVDALTAKIEGSGGLNLHRLKHVETGDLYIPEWLDLETWTVMLTLQPGVNVFTLQGLDVLGGTGSLFSPVGRAELVITSTAEPNDGEGEGEALRILDVAVNDGGESLIVTYERRVVAEEVVLAEWSGDLREWSEVPAAVETSVARDGDWETFTLRVERKPNEPANYLRLRSFRPRA